MFCHKELTYLYEVKNDQDWMSKYFFTGGMMPGSNYPLLWSETLDVEDRWVINGLHYTKTAEAWLKNCDAHQQEILSLFKKNYTAETATIWLQRWRIFFMACAEFFKFRQGEEWYLVHYLFKKKISS